MSRILVIEDDADIRELIVATLSEGQHTVIEAVCGKEGIEAFHKFDPDLVILDLGLPEIDGLEVCRRLRSTSSVPVIMLTARADEIDELLGLGVGADDYVTKPFAPRVLQARITAALRRQTDEQPDRVRLVRFDGVLVIDIDARVVDIWPSKDSAGAVVALTRIEFDLLYALARSPERVVTRRQLLDEVWDDWFGDDHVVETHISRLRAKVKAAGGPRIGQSVRGIGYRLGSS